MARPRNKEDLLKAAEEKRELLTDSHREVVKRIEQFTNEQLLFGKGVSGCWRVSSGFLFCKQHFQPL